MKKTYIYSEDQVNELYRYLMQKPMLEVEKYVTILRNPVKVNDETTTEKQENAVEQQPG